MREFPLLDQPRVRRLLFYPRRDFSAEPAVQGARCVSVEVETGVKIVCRFYPAGKENPSILYFHGNGETAGDYDYIAPEYTSRGINFFVADYRGYGLSDGEPSVSAMINDAHPIFAAFKEFLEKEGYKFSLFVMGRSLGSAPAIELASCYQDELRSLIIESGFANSIRLLSYLGILSLDPALEVESGIGNAMKIRSVVLPTLIIHAEFDTLVPLQEGKELFESAGAKEKKLFVVPNVDHNTIMLVGGARYFDEIAGFVRTHSR